MRKIKQRKDEKGYLMFYCNGKTTYAHRFVAECFLPNPENLPCINHKDETRDNNCVSNLEWCDHKYNNNYGTHIERVGKKMKKYWGSEENRKKMSETLKNHPKLSKKVYQYTKDGVFVKEWCSIREIGRVLGFGIGHISRCCLGKQKTAYDFKWSHEPLN